jgi:hypothetical protein
MTERVVNSNIKTMLVANSPFEYAYLVKFERPFDKLEAELGYRKNANRYAYYTNASRDIAFNDGSVDHDGNSNGSQVYRANRLLSVGNYSETTQPRAINVGLTFAGEHVGTSISVTGDFASSGSSATFTLDTTFFKGDNIDLIDQGFREGDLVKFTKSSGNFSTINTTTASYIITGFTSDNTSITLARTGDDTDDTAFFSENNVSVTMSLESGEIKTIITDKGSSSLASPSFLNREVFIHKVFFDPDTGDMVGNSSILLFRGIVSSCSFSESETAPRVKWTCASHWSDFNMVNSRITSDEVHRALDQFQRPQPTLAIKPEYATDLGFIHAETTLSQIAQYKTFETETEIKNKRMGGLGGLFGLKKAVQVEKEVEKINKVDLNIALQGRHLPVVYGVQRIPGIKVFADTDATKSNIVFTADALCEGPIHGVYNMYIDGVPLICTDEKDSIDRGADNSSSTGTRENSALQCYGRADHGDTIGGAGDQASDGSVANVGLSDSNIGTNENVHEGEDLDSSTRDAQEGGRGQNNQSEYQYRSINLAAAQSKALSSQTNAEGLQHENYGTITHPFSMSFTFHQGSNTQKASNLLTTQAQSPGFKRQQSYYDSSLPYWSPDHRLLDTAYMVNALVIEEDQTSVPEIEYVVKGRVIENYNYDNSYVPDPRGSSFGDDHTNFTEGLNVTVERSSDGTSYTATTVEGDSSDNVFRILHKYLFVDDKGGSHYRFILDETPDLDEVNGVPGKTYLRLKLQGSNTYWHMRTWNHSSITDVALPVLKYSPSAVTKNGSNNLVLTFSSAHAGFLKNGYENEISAGGNGALYRVLPNDAAGLSNMDNVDYPGTWSGNDLTLVGTNFPSIDSIANRTNIEVFRSKIFEFSSSSAIGQLTAATELEGCELVLDTGTKIPESRTIDDFDTTNNRIKLDAPFQTLTETVVDNFSPKFDIVGLSSDKRASINPAIQLLDYMTDDRYGHQLDINNDMDLASFKGAAKLCDVRSDVSLVLSNQQSMTEGDIYRLTADGTSTGAHVASGRVSSSSDRTFTSVTGSSGTKTRVTFDLVSNKFIRLFNTHSQYSNGEIVVNGDNYYRYTGTNPAFINDSQKPVHTTGTTNDFLFLGSKSSPPTITLYKESGSGPSSVTLDSNFQPTYSLYDGDFVKYWRYYGWQDDRQWNVTRHQTNFIMDTSKSTFANIQAFLSHMNGLLSYQNGKYNLDIETQESAPASSTTFDSVTYNWNVNPEFIDNSDIIGSITLVENSAKDAKNTIKASIVDPQNNWGARSVTFFNSEYLKADRNVVKSGNFNYSGITNYYNARIGTEKELIASRYNQEISFTLGPKGMLLKAGAVIALTYEPFGYDKKLFRIENLSFQQNCNVSVKAKEYNDQIYTITEQRANELRLEAATQAILLATPGTPASLSATTTRPGIIELNWTNPSDYDEQRDDIEIHASDTNNRANATKIAIVNAGLASGAGTFQDALGIVKERYYWIRTRRETTSLGANTSRKKFITGNFHPTSATGGVQGNAKLLSAGISLNKVSGQIRFDKNNTLNPANAAQDVSVTATLRFLTGTPTFTLLDIDGSSQTDVQFTTGSETGTGTTFVVDASTFSHTTTPKLLRVSLTESGETFTAEIPFEVILDGQDGSDGQSVKTVQLFKNNDSSFATTTAGTFSDPTNGVESGWSTTQPALSSNGDETYMVRRTFTSDGQSPQDSTWSSPVVVARRTDGTEGDDGPRVVNGYIYYQSSSASSPTSGAAVSTTGVTYNFSTGLLSGGVIGTGSTNFNQIAPTFTGSNSNKYWYAYFQVRETTFGGSQNVTFSIPYQGQNFTGLVTFTGTNSISDGGGNTISLGSSGTTAIDGGSIITGTITANKINTSSITLNSFTNDSGFVNSSGAAAAAPVQSVNGGTGAVTITASGLSITSGDVGGLGALATLNNIDLSKVTDSGTLAGLNSAVLGTHTSGTLPESQGGTGQNSDTAYAAHLGSQGLIVTEVAGSTGAVSAATIVSAGNILVSSSNVTRNGSGQITQISGGIIRTGKIESANISGTTDGSNFTGGGTVIDLDNDVFASENFRIDSSGDAFFRGSLDVSTGTINGTNMTINNISASSISSGTLTASGITVSGTLALPSTGGSQSVSFTVNDKQNRFIAAVGSGAGFYTGFVKITGGTNHVKSIGLYFIDSSATSGQASSFDIDLSAPSNGSTNTPLAGKNKASAAVYPSSEAVLSSAHNNTPQDGGYGLRPFILSHGIGFGSSSQKSNAVGTTDRLFQGHESINIPIAFTYTGSNTVNLFMRGQGDSGTDTCTVEVRMMRFGAS